MKKLILALFAVSAIATVNAQKNSILVYGSAGVNFSNNNLNSNFSPSTLSTNQNIDRNYWDYNIAPGIGYQFSRNMTVGLQGGYSKSHQEELTNQLNMATMTTSTTNSEWTLGAFYRYTHYLSNIFSVYGQVNAGYVSGNIKQMQSGGVSTVTGNTMNTASGEYDGFQGTLFPAFAINVHKGWALNFGFGGLSYRSLSYEPGTLGRTSFSMDRPEYSNSFNLTLGQQFNLTITKNIGCGKWGRHGRGKMEPGSEMRRMDANDDDENEDDRPRRIRRHRDTNDDDE